MRTAIVIVDDTYGFGPRFKITEAEWSDKTVRFKPVRGAGASFGIRHRRGTQRFCKATVELAAEVIKFQAEKKRLDEWARKIRAKITAGL